MIDTVLKLLSVPKFYYEVPPLSLYLLSAVS